MLLFPYVKVANAGKPGHLCLSNFFLPITYYFLLISSLTFIASNFKSLYAGEYKKAVPGF